MALIFILSSFQRGADNGSVMGELPCVIFAGAKMD
jgi:hypothetical protein